ncbi:MAG: hypothetical protein WCV72_02640 [Patescibacteria group bacterium]|jgi:hypothetical protein
MDDEEILELVADGELDPSQIDDFNNLNDELQTMVVDGELTMDEALEIDG